jgi:DNA-binding MarR family transcriptional regulator
VPRPPPAAPDPDRSPASPVEDACSCGRLRRASRALTRFYDDALESAGLSVTQYSLLSNLARRGTMRMSDFAEAYLVDRTALGRMLDPLVERGYVAIARGQDARTREASITRQGRTALAAARNAWKRAQGQVVHKLGPERLEALIGTLAELESLHPGAHRPTRRKDTP